jgi:aryl-alcohol dehydrogenase-like predicted oxidoreductase
VILGATRVEQLRENLSALHLAIPTETQAELDELFPGEKPRGGPFS